MSWRRAVVCRLSALVVSGVLAAHCGAGHATGGNEPQCGGDRGLTSTSGEPQRSRAFSSFALTEDGARFAVTVDDGSWSGLFVYDVASGKLLWQRMLSGPASAIALSANGDALALAYAVRPLGCPHVELFDGDGRARPLEDRAKLSNIVNDSARSVVFAPGGTLVVASLDNEIRAWDVSSGRNAIAIEPPGIESAPGIEPVEELAFSPDGSRLAGGSARRPAVYVWDARTGQLERALSLRKFSGSFGSIAFNRDGSLIAVGSTGPIALWNARTGTAMGEIVKPAAGPIGPVGFLGEGKLVVNGPSKLELWDVSRRPIARDVHWKGGEASVDTAFIVRSGVIGLVADASSWASEPSRPGRVKLLAAGTNATIANFEVPGRPATP